MWFNVSVILLTIVLCAPLALALSDINTTGYLWTDTIMYAPQICLNGDCQTFWPSGEGVSTAGGWSNTSVLVSLTDATDNVSIGSTPTLFVDNTNGLVGIGTNSPQTYLDISAAVPRIRWTDTGANDIAILADGGELMIRDEDATQYIASFKTSQIQFLISGAAAMTINSGGHVLGSGYINATTDLCIIGGACLSDAGSPTLQTVTDSGALTTNAINITSTANPGLNVGNDAIGYIKIGGSVISDATGNLQLDSDTGTVQTAPGDDLLIGGNDIKDSGGTTRITVGSMSNLHTNLYVNDSNVGIGTATPSGKLHINNGVVIIDKDYGIRGDGMNGNGRSYIWALSNTYPDRGISYYEASPDYISIHPGSTTNVLAITDSGKVGIGTADPLAALHVADGELWVGEDGVLDGKITLRDSGAITNEAEIFTDSGGSLYLKAHASSANLNLQGSDTGVNGYIYFGDDDTNFGYFITGQTNQGDFSVDGTTFYVDASTGRVGIGVAAPDVALEVVGAIHTSRLGTYGTYNSAQVQGIWSIQNNYLIDTGADDFGSQYGMGYAYGTNGGAPFAGEHTIVFTNNGAIGAAIGLQGSGYFAGDVGIGVANPGTKLEVYKTSGSASINITSGDGEYYTELTNYRQWSEGLPMMTLKGRTGEVIIGQYMRSSQEITALMSGNVGIGTTDPDGNLHVVGTTGNLGIFQGTNKNITFDGDASDSGIVITSKMIYDGITINNIASIGDSRIKFQLSGVDTFVLGIDDSDGDKFKISTGELGAANDRFVIDSAGNVGIGTDSPTAPLHIRGTGSADSSPNVEGVQIGAGGNYGHIEMTGTSGAYIDFQNDISGTDYDARIIVTSDNLLQIEGADLMVGTSGFWGGGIASYTLSSVHTAITDLGIYSDRDIVLALDADGSRTAHLYVQDGADTTIMDLDESGNLQMDGDLTVSGGDIIGANNINIRPGSTDNRVIFEDTSTLGANEGRRLDILFDSSYVQLIATDYEGDAELLQIPNGLYVSGGTPYFTNGIVARGGIYDDGGDLILNDQTAIGSATTGLQVTIDGTITDIDDAAVTIGEELVATLITVSGGQGIAWESGVNRITHNDGGGNVQIRFGNDFTDSDERFTHNAGTAYYIGGNLDAATGTLQFKVASNGGAGNNAAVTWGDLFYVKSDRIQVIGLAQFGTGTGTYATGNGEVFVTGDLEYDGTLYAPGSDLSEIMQSEDDYEKGEVVVLSESISGVTLTQKPFDNKVAGVVTSNPAMVLGSDDEGTPIAISGRVPIIVNDENGPIKVGDYLVTSSTPGEAMGCQIKELDLSAPEDERWQRLKDNDSCRGAAFAKAMEPNTSGGMITGLVLLN